MADYADVSTLNTLIKTTIDSVKGFEDSAEHTDDSRFSSLFREFAEERRRVVQQLQQEVRRLGEEPEDDGSVAGAAHRAFIDLKEAVATRDDKAVIEEVERGEDYLKTKYEAALADDAVSGPIRAAIERAYQSVRAGHDKASQLKHGYSGS
jgi:uncharacterized protein (TIGR02284 family)